MYPSTVTFLNNYETKNKKRAAIVYTLLSSLCFFLVNLCVKFSLSIPANQSLYLRSMLILGFSLLIIQIGGFQIHTKSGKINNLLVSRGFLGGLSLSLFNTALYLLPLSYFSVLQRLTPLWVGILGAIFYKEPFKAIYLMITCVCLVGVVFIVQPAFFFPSKKIDSKGSYDLLIGVVLVLLNNICIAVVFLTIKAAKNATNVIVVVFYSTVFNAIFTGLGQLFEELKSFNINEGFLMFFAAFFSWIAQISRARALFLEKAFLVSILTYSQLILGYLSDYFILGSQIDLFGNLGIIIIIFSTVYLLYREGIS